MGIDLVGCEVKKKRMERGEKMTSLLLKPHSTPATLLWLQSNYETMDGICIPRNAMYSQIIRQQFSGLTTRRFGTRGQSRYHYYGLAAKSDTNLYAQSSFTRYGFKNSKQAKMPGTNKGSLNSRCYMQNPLCKFPSKEILKNLPKNLSKNETETILIMYTLHCQQLIDFSTTFHFQEVKEYILHFWEEFPSHLAPFLEHPSILSLIGTCDHIMYRAIAHATMPCVMMKEVPAAKAEDVIHLAEKIIDWLVISLANFPLVLRRMKLHAARTLLHCVRRQASLNHLCSTLRFILASEVHLKQMLTDWEHLDFGAVADEMNGGLFRRYEEIGSKHNYASQIIIPCCKELEKLLKSRPQLAELRDWMKNLVERCVTTQLDSHHVKSGEYLKNFACHFVLIWSSIGTRFLRELTLLGAHSFGTFHLLYLMLTDYGAQLVESLIMEDRIQRLTANVSLGNPLQNNDFDAGTLCDAQCPCKMMCQHREEMQNNDELTNKSMPIDSTSLNSPMMMHSRDIVSDSNVFSALPPHADGSRYCQVFPSDQSSEFCQASECSHPYNSSQPQPEHSQEEIISRPSCSFHQNLTDLPTCEYDTRNEVGKNEMKVFVPLEEEEEEEICEEFPDTNLHCCLSPVMADYYNSPNICIQDNTSNSNSFYISSTVSGGQMDNFYNSADVNFLPMSHHTQYVPPQTELLLRDYPSHRGDIHYTSSSDEDMNTQTQQPHRPLVT